MRRHSLAAACALDTPPKCTRCGAAFGAELIWRRVFTTPLGLTLAALCTRCAEAVPRGSTAESEMRAQLEDKALASVPALGRA
jgi:hypothetical protein